MIKSKNNVECVFNTLQTIDWLTEQDATNKRGVTEFFENFKSLEKKFDAKANITLLTGWYGTRKAKSLMQLFNNHGKPESITGVVSDIGEYLKRGRPDNTILTLHASDDREDSELLKHLNSKFIYTKGYNVNRKVFSLTGGDGISGEYIDSKIPLMNYHAISHVFAELSGTLKDCPYGMWKVGTTIDPM